jgi:hypothetical protein
MHAFNVVLNFEKKKTTSSSSEINYIHFQSMHINYSGVDYAREVTSSTFSSSEINYIHFF